MGVDPASLTAQELTLKRAVPGADNFSCPAADSLPEPTEEERTEALRLGSNADQALILGDQERARDLLSRATEMDPTSPELAYRLARVLEEMGSRGDAIAQYCQVLALGPQSAGIEDAETRLRGILDSERTQIPDGAVEAFTRGLAEADDGDLQAAVASFSSAWQQAPSWADAVYNRGIVYARQGQTEAAQVDLEEYLALRPDAGDAILVSQRIGQLRSLGNLPRPAAAFTLGLLFPGAGQFYSGRAMGGLTVLTLSAGAVAAGFLIERVTVSCVGSVSGGDCPPDRVIGEKTDRPYMVHGLAAAGAVAVIGAIESYFGARGRQNREMGALVAVETGGARLEAPAIRADGPRLRISLVQVTF
jgi:tetratricopeptide (TPR) repeat protein